MFGKNSIMTKSNSTVDQTFNYLLFCEEIAGTSSTGSSLRFTGEERDTE